MQNGGSVRDTWFARLHSTDPADRPRAEAAAGDLYASAGFARPRHHGWFESPFRAAWAVAVLLEAQHPVWRDLIGAARKSRASRQQIDDAEAALCRMCGAPAIDAARAAMGTPLGLSLQYHLRPDALLQPKLVSARIALYAGNVSGLAEAARDDALSTAERRLSVGARAILASPLICHPAGTLVAQSFCNDYPMSWMASDQDALRGDAPAMLRAAWDIAAAAGLWWPCSGGVIFAERPSEVHTDQDGFLHDTEGAAASYRDGTRVYAWHGVAVSEDWILRPETIPPAKLRGFDPRFRKHVESRRARTTAPRPGRPSAILAANLPGDPAARLDALRAHAGGSLPLFDRYARGDYAAVWNELRARGADVRMDPVAADALAVAYETMRRVRENVGTLVARLASLGFEFTTPDGRRRPIAEAHVLPDSRTAKQVRRLEKRAGPLPLSLRAFCEIVGAVDLIGRHPTIAPPREVAAVDPLVVAGIDDILSEIDSSDEADLLVLAPDHLHKASISGGDPYGVGVPDPSADGVLLNERHEAPFVDYLRLCCRFGGFPGYDGREDVPAEIDALRRELLAF